MAWGSPPVSLRIPHRGMLGHDDNTIGWCLRLCSQLPIPSAAVHAASLAVSSLQKQQQHVTAAAMQRSPAGWRTPVLPSARTAKQKSQQYSVPHLALPSQQASNSMSSRNAPAQPALLYVLVPKTGSRSMPRRLTHLYVPAGP